MSLTCVLMMMRNMSVKASGSRALIARFDMAEYRLCRRLNRGVAVPSVRAVFQAASRLGDGLIWYILLAALPIFYGERAFAPTLVMAATSLCGLALYKWLKRTFVRERPFMRYQGISLVGVPLDRYSFPSGHTLHAVLFAWQGSAFAPGLAWVLIPLAALIAGSRVVLGLHYPSDVLIGGALGAALAMIGTSLV